MKTNKLSIFNASSGTEHIYLQQLAQFSLVPFRPPYKLSHKKIFEDNSVYF